MSIMNAYMKTKTTPTIIANRIKTPDGTIVESRHRHDYSCHTDANGFRYCVDGGPEYLRRTFDKDAPPAEDVSVYSDDPHELIREVMRWGTRGMDGSEPLKYLPLKDMTSTHIQNCLDTQNKMLPAYRVAMQNELNHRKVTW